MDHRWMGPDARSQSRSEVLPVDGCWKEAPGKRTLEMATARKSHRARNGTSSIASTVVRDLRFWRWRKAEDDDLDRELRLHIELATEERVEAGISRDDALRAARREFGSVALRTDEVRDMRTGAALERLLQEMRYAVRRLLRSPAFTTATVLTLALAIGANASIFAVVYRVVLHALPYGESERLLALEFSVPARTVPKVYYIP